ncbi:MAG: sensor histidine kinase [Paracoccaceae bacterium]|nr:sensor histidine kinase [Paracoccaceae bacterium]
MKNLTFKVSAKTARLFGRENVSNAEAAISELIKNTYDADATICIVCFLPTYRSAPETISAQEYSYLLARDEQIQQFYCLTDDGSASLVSSDKEGRNAAYSIVQKLVDLWIIDNGTGMSGKTIEECWMVIGTNDKEKNIMSKKGRARTGAKGIGRFALDRLGNRCTLHSSCNSDGSTQSVKWDVDWSEFDGEGKVLDDISARMDENGEPLRDVLKFVADFPQVAGAIDGLFKRRHNLDTGTVIRIGFLRDSWTRQEIDRLNKTLGALIPPLEQRELTLFLYDASNPTFYGQVSVDILDDYDYRLEAAFGKNGNVEFDLFRNELERVNVDPDLFTLQEMKQTRFKKSSFQKKKITYCETVENLFPGRTNKFFRHVRELGPFKVKLLFFKKGSPSKRDADIYPYRPFQPGPRKAWLEEFGGIKIYRDNFAVRPYGELDGRAFDWLALGQRVAISPVAASRKGWKVSPQNLAGTVSISRRWNQHLCDQTNREGLIENEHFAVFRELILRVIQEFEDDRSHIHYNLNELYKRKNKTEEDKTAGAITASRIVRTPEKATPQDAQQLARAFVAQQEEIRELRDEQAMLRALATLGTVLVSFSHEMGQLQNTMGSRSAVLSDILSSYISPDELVGVSGPFNPYTILEEWEEDDKRVKQWFTFALSSVNAGRRRRRNVSLREHLQRTKSIWKGFLEPREVDLNIEFEDDETDVYIMAFEIDLDSIFNNLILNSVEAFLSSRHVGKRQIDIGVAVSKDIVRIDYRDNGPGIHLSIKDPVQIFRFAVTTKVGPDGKANGTGLGMWILAAVLQSFDGSYKAFRSRDQKGFRMEFTLPVSKKGDDRWQS